jgi:hypothetical protein
MKIQNTVQFFVKFPNIKFYENSSGGSVVVSFVWTDGQTDWENVIGAPQGFERA